MTVVNRYNRGYNWLLLFASSIIHAVLESINNDFKSMKGLEGKIMKAAAFKPSIFTIYQNLIVGQLLYLNLVYQSITVMHTNLNPAIYCTYSERNRTVNNYNLHKSKVKTVLNVPKIWISVEMIDVMTDSL